MPEQQNVLLVNDLPVDHRAPVCSGLVVNPGFIPAGTTVASWLFHADIATLPNPLGRLLLGDAEFSTDVLGLIYLDQTLCDTDPVVGNPGTTYHSCLDADCSGRRGIDIGFGDEVCLGIGRRTVGLTLGVRLCLDNVRVIVGCEA